MKAAFEDWLNADLDTTDNPYRNNSAAYWAWEGWKAGAAAEREACATINELERQINELKRADPTQRNPLTKVDLRALYDQHAAYQLTKEKIKELLDIETEALPSYRSAVKELPERFARAVEREHRIGVDK